MQLVICPWECIVYFWDVKYDQAWVHVEGCKFVFLGKAIADCAHQRMVVYL
jgi:hypothetical protein